MPGNLLLFTDENIEYYIRQEKMTIVHFYEDQDSDCRKLAPILEKIADNHCHKYNIGKMAFAANPTTCAAYNVKHVPLTVIFKDGRPVAGSSGLISERELIGVAEMLQATSSESCSKPNCEHEHFHSHKTIFVNK
jgi:thioredoxin 1